MRRFLLIATLFVIANPVQAENKENPPEKSAFHVTKDEKGNIHSFACFGPQPKKDVDVDRWLGVCEQKIRRSRQRKEDVFASTTVQCSFTVDEVGDLVDLRIVKTSGTNTVDETALNTIKESAPFALTSDQKQKIRNLEILVTFGKLPTLSVTSRIRKENR